MSVSHPPVIIPTRHAVPLMVMALTVLLSPPVMAEDNPSDILEKIQENPFSMESSVTVSAEQILKAQDPRVPEIAARLQDRLSRLKAAQNNRGGGFTGESNWTKSNSPAHERS